MFLFELYYIDIDTGKEIKKMLEVDRNLFNTDKEVFLYAMNIAYDIMKPYEFFYRLDYKGSY